MFKCRYFKVCKLANPESVVCLHGGGPYCGHYRTWCQAERDLKKERKQRRHAKKRKIL